jgi:putative membrane protein
MDWMAQNLPHATASLNATATVLLLLALAMIKQGKVAAHRNLMLTALVVSSAFLGLYLLHKVALFQTTGSYNKPFPRDPEIASATARTIYFCVLATHVPLAITVPFLAIWSAVLGIKDRREAHRRVVKFAFPVWLYVSVTGVVVYLMLYQIYKAP